MRIATWNVNSLRVRMEHLGRWLAANAVDAIALQELKLADEHFPRADFEAMNVFLTRHRLKPVIDRAFDFADATAAYDYMESGNHFGKIVIRLP